MQLRDQTRPSINPRRLVTEQGLEAIVELLRTTDYIIQGRLLTDLRNSLISRKPLLIEGPRGGGKTALAEALASACNLTTFYLQGTEELTLGDVLYSWDREEQIEMFREEKELGTPIAEIRARKYSREFLTLGEALGAFDYAAKADVPPILIIDEVDKLVEKIEDMMLQLLGRGYANVPRIEGIIGLRDRARWPIVMLLSNNIRHDLSEPLRSRCIYNWLEPPAPAEEVKILRQTVPEATPYQIAAVVKIINYIRRDLPNVRDKPGLRESIDLLRILVADGINSLTENVIDDYLSFLGKKRKELMNLRQGLARLEEAANAPDEEISGWVCAAFAEDNEELEEVAA